MDCNTPRVSSINFVLRNSVHDITRALSPAGDTAHPRVMNLQTPHYCIIAVEGRKFRRLQRAAANCIRSRCSPAREINYVLNSLSDTRPISFEEIDIDRAVRHFVRVIKDVNIHYRSHRACLHPMRET